MNSLVFDQDLDLHAVSAVAGDGANEVMGAGLVESHGGVAVGILGAQRGVRGALCKV